ncbi:ScyD/ScyE family protein [Yeosuana sp. MJ-SS3]|uniref:ScyD/ScyE family protein n=1 Tax=Gilvirhabdus luticola TaxID=3079858 RepID=A0ABU3U8L9_9FLAO|nr:ScyD/ScyE family protein [Yeosuana sp. MJ-SS3]MDU8886646.1 ScyD/ScyE family protein [Yeosuana sp. MJ-SS3]
MKTLNQLFFRKAPIRYGRPFLGIVIMICFTIISCSNENAEANSNEELMLSETSNLSKQMVPGSPQLLAALPDLSVGSTVGPDGHLYVGQTGPSGSILKVNKDTGEITTFASELPTSVVPIGGVIDVAFIDETAYALVTLVGPLEFFGTDFINGIYRIDGPDSNTLIADIGTFATENPPTGFDYFLPMGLQYAMQTYRGGFLVTDGHHNRMYHVTLAGEVSEFKVFGNIVPTGLEVSGNMVYMTEAGTSAESNLDSRVIAINSHTKEVNQVGSGIPFLVDVQMNRGQTLYALSQGIWTGGNDGDSAEPNTGSLVKVNSDGSLTTVVEELDRPTSLEFIQNTAYIITLTGEIWTIDNVAGPPYGN